jgi:hypothetical protein
MRPHPLDFDDFGGISNPSHGCDIRLYQRCTLIPIHFQALLRNRVVIMP